MDLIQRYLQAVKFWLPREMQDDIAAEISEDLYSQEAELGRQLTQPEWEAILKKRGSPMMVANSYLPQRYLIGPTLFPIYRFVLKIIGLCYLLPSVAIWVGMVILMPSYRIAHPGFSLFWALWGHVWWIVIGSTFVVTAIFAVLERSQVQSKLLKNWNPGKLPPVRDTGRISRANSVFEMVVNLMAASWIAAAMAAPVLFETNGLRIALTSPGRIFAAGLMVISLMIAGLSAANLLRPYWTRTRRSVRVVCHLLTALLFGFMFHAGPLVDFSGSGIGVVMQVVNRAMPGVALAGVGIAVLMAILEARHLFRGANSGAFLLVPR